MKLLACFAALFALCNVAMAKDSKACSLVCDAKDFSRPVCGSDGETYQSKCILRLKKCTSGKKLYVEYTGACRAPPSCAEERKRVLKSIRERDLLHVGIFIPDCDADGSYSEIQCSQNRRLCWCVDKYGVEVDDTRVKEKKPDCRYRRGNPQSSNERYARMLKGCSKDNRVNFNKAVMSSFKKEMNAKLSGKKGKLNSKRIAEWKMNELDVDKNGLLKNKEVRALVKIFKSRYTPKKCGKTFFYYCDENQDFYISKKEWLKCLGVQETQDSPQCFTQQTRAKEEQKKNPTTTVFIPSCNKDGTYRTVQCEKVSKYCWCVHPVTGRNIPNTSVHNAKPDCSKPPRKVKPRPVTPDPKQKKRQIIRKTTPPPKENKPREVNEKKVKECDEATWRRFCNELVNTLRKELETITRARLGGNSTKGGKQGQDFIWAVLPRLPDAMITAWKFSQLDINRDRLLRNEELFSPHMKKTFGLIRRGRKCSKKLADSCDLDRNGGLSLEEWRKCLGRKTTSKGFLIG